jgi:hypothetical protein
MDEGTCPDCWAMALEDVGTQRWRTDWRYRHVMGVHHAFRWTEPGTRGPHLDDPYRL